MDIDQHGEVLPSEEPDSPRIILPSEALPGAVYILPQGHRPFFPGQAFPLLMPATPWIETLQAIQSRKHNVVGVIATRRDLNEVPATSDLHPVGTVCRIHRVHREGEQLQVLLEGLQRFSVRQWVRDTPPLLASVQYLPERAEPRSAEQKAYAVAIINMIKELIPLNPLYGEELKVFLARSNPNEPALLADFAASLTSATREELQDVLETLPLQRRMEKVVTLLQRELEIARAQMEIRRHVESEIQGRQREVVLRQQLKYIQQELGLSKDDRTAELEKFRARIAERAVPAAAAQRIEDELGKLATLEVGSPEYGVTRNYLDWLTSVPWGVASPDQGDLQQARRVLDQHHAGLADVKARMVEFLALGIMKGDVAGSIICLAGPPGVGKTSLGRAVAEALGRRFFRFSVGGMRDEAEIKGHRRTYIGAMPGKLIRALRETGVANPVIMLDEIDKIGASYQGDPASALLEALDPEQNSAFHDHYLDVDVDLSKVLFICTANQLDSIPGPLLDRMEVITLPGYLDVEKLAIARSHLLPRQLARAGLRARGDIEIGSATLRRVIEGHSREAGVRRLDKALATLVRKNVVRLLEGAARPIRVTPEAAAADLGPAPYTPEALEQGIGIVTGLAWTPVGGATLPIEATLVHQQQATLKLTGQLGDVMQESANIAWSVLRGSGSRYGIPEHWFDQAALHLHVPAGATPKDGPSAGIAMASAMLSRALGRAPKRGYAMTGELTLSGRVYPVGGIREKLLAARRLGLRNIILPEANRRDFDEIPESVRQGLRVTFVSHFDEVAALLFGPVRLR